jgi:hypothetical protein
MSSSRSQRFHHLVVASLIAATSACQRTPEPSSGSNGAPTPSGQAPALSIAAPSPAAPPTAAASAQQEPLHITWVDPPAFKRVPPSNPMRKAAFVVPKVAGDTEDGELTVFYFGPGQGGSIDANVERWVSQFSGTKPGDVKRADRTANGLTQHTVELASGSYAGMGGQAKPSFGLLGAIVEAPSGMYFFKLTGPSKTVTQAKKDFYGLLDSIKPS